MPLPRGNHRSWTLCKKCHRADILLHPDFSTPHVLEMHVWCLWYLRTVQPLFIYSFFYGVCLCTDVLLFGNPDFSLELLHRPKAKRNNVVQGFFWTCAFVSLEHVPSNRISGLLGRGMFHFFRNCHQATTLFQSGCAILYFHRPHMRVFASLSHQCLIF